MTNQQFLETITPIIKKEAMKRGYKYPEAIIAQAALESNYGRSGLSAKYHNYFGMKAGSSWKGKSVNMKTKEEYTAGTLTTIKDNFRCYDSMEAGVIGYFDFIGSKRYENLKSATSARNYLELIKADGYATSSKYVDNIMAVIEKYGLEEPDIQEVFGKPSETPSNLTQVARDVIAGKYGNGAHRRIALHRAGYNYNDVQAEVNRLLKGGK